VPKPVGIAVITAGLLVLSQIHGAAADVDVPPDYQVLVPVDGIGPVDRTRLDTRVDASWDDPALGPVKGLAIDAFASPSELEVDRGADTPLMPASTTKLLTAVAALKAFGPEARFATTVARDGRRLVLVGGGDPQLTTAAVPRTINANTSLTRLARLTAEALSADAVTSVNLQYDASLFSPPSEAPFWKKDFLAIGVVAPITALSADGGRLNPPASPRSPDPPLTAAQAFAGLLEQRGIQVTGEPRPGQARGQEIARVESPPLSDLVEHMLLVSDNTEADILAHHVGREVLGEATFAGGAKATVRVLSDLGVNTKGIVLEDGSGLARRNRVTPRQLLEVLHAAMQTDPVTLWPAYTGLPVAGFDGSLAVRFSAPDARAARGAVTGKTGTLTGTSTLAGLVSDRSGALLTYAVMTNDVSVWTATGAIDELLARVAGCRCAAGAASPSAG
jgi:D-alanyl-D-alanine carboxypeptidase/D-alanyl-D-alanine-endopeptidase (penicillin-binding protein 4)